MHSTSITVNTKRDTRALIGNTSAYRLLEESAAVVSGLWYLCLNDGQSRSIKISRNIAIHKGRNIKDQLIVSQSGISSLNASKTVNRIANNNAVSTQIKLPIIPALEVTSK